MTKGTMLLGLVLMLLVALLADAPFTEATSLLVAIPIGVATGPTQMQLTPDGSKLLVSNEAAGTVSIIWTATDSVLATVTVGSGPGPIRVLPDGSKAYVVNEFSNNVSVINVATNSFIKNIAVGTLPVTLSRTDDGTKVYVANKTDGTVSVINTTTDTVVAPSPISVGLAPNTMAKTPDGSKLYVANETSNSISVLSTITSAVTATISLNPAISRDPGSIHFLPDGTKAYVANRGCVANGTTCLVSVPPTVSVIDVATSGILTTINPVGAVGAAPHAMRITPDGSKLYLVNKHGDEVKVISTASNTITKTISLQSGSCTNIALGPGACPVRIELTPDSSYAFVVEERPLAAEGTLTGICTGMVPAVCAGTLTDTVVWRSNVNNSPVDLEITPGGKAYLSNSGSGNVSVWVDSDGDRCPDANEQQTAVGTEASGGRRDRNNPWDYFEPTKDHLNRVDDILAVVNQYHKDRWLNPPTNTIPNPAYNPDTDRSVLGPNPWNLGPPDGIQRVDDILDSVKQYHHDCP